MGDAVEVDDHAYKHGLGKADILFAWSNYARMSYRGAPNEGEIAVVGYDRQGRAIQMVAIERPAGILIYHAMTPPTDKILGELGML